MGIEEDSARDMLEPLFQVTSAAGGDIDVSDKIPSWKEQITVRGLVVSALLGCLFCIITHKLNLTVGVIPSLNVAAGLLGFFFVRSWTGILNKLGFRVSPFTRQENTVIQTCVVACYGLAFSGGFGSYMLSMDQRTYELIGRDYPGNRPEDIKNPSLGWMIGFMFVVSFLGLFSLVALRKVMVIDYKLTYPSGTATALLINSFHTNAGAELAEKQVRCLGKYLSISFLWCCFKWFFSGVGDSCGFDNFPTLGLTAFKNTFYFDFSPTYIGCGLICPHIVNCSVFLGAIISWGFLWPFISKHAGDWYPVNLGSNDFKGLYGYKVFIAISLILGDGLYNLIKIIYMTVKEMLNEHSKNNALSFNANQYGENSRLQLEKLRDSTFVKDSIPSWFAASGYIVLASISTATIPLIFPQMKWYLVLTCYLVAPALAFWLSLFQRQKNIRPDCGFLSSRQNPRSGCRIRFFQSTMDSPFLNRMKEESSVESNPHPAASAPPQPMKGLQDFGPPPFLTKTYDMVDDASTDQVVSWSKMNNSFVVWDPYSFAMDLLPKNFKHNNFSSFIRQLNTYGFRKVDPGRWEFANEGFLRGQKHLLKTIKRRRQPTHPPQPQSSMTCFDVGTYELDGEIDHLARDKCLLMSEVIKLRQDQQNSKARIQAMAEKLQGLELKQQHMITFLARVIQNPSLLHQLAERQNTRKELEQAVSKKRKHFIDISSAQQIQEPETIFDLIGEEELYGCEISELEDITLGITGSDEFKHKEQHEEQVQEGELNDEFWHKMVNEMIFDQSEISG